jgi:glycosyltransferase involved in cell wall biosynthesis
MKQPLVILHILDTLETGGTERQVATFVLRSDPNRFRHEVCVLDEGGRYAADLEAAGVRVHNLGLASSHDVVRSILRLWRFVRQVRPNILHATLYRPGVVARIVGWLHRIPVVTTLVNASYEPEWLLDNPRLHPRKVWLALTVDRLTSRWFGTQFIAVTDIIKAWAVRRLGIRPERIAVIERGLITEPQPAPPPDEVSARRAMLGWAEAYPLILNVGRLVPQKGQQYAILAMREVVAKFPTAQLVIAGEGWLQPDLERLIKEEGLQTHVTLLGERKDVNLLLGVADLFMFPSLYEGSANALMEAMAAGKPCVVSDIPALRKITCDGAKALLARLQSPADFAAKLLRLAEDRAMAANLGRDARAWVHARYDLQASVEALQTLYEGLAAGRGAAARSTVREPLSRRGMGHRLGFIWKRISS